MNPRLNKIIRHPLWPTLIRFAVGGLFVVFSVSKMLSPLSHFVEDIRAYDMLPEVVLPAFAVVMIGLEFGFGLLLLLGLFTRLSLFVVSGLLVMFHIAIIQALVRGVGLVDCGCVGDNAILKLFGESPGEVLLRDAIMLVALIVLIITRQTGWTIDRLLHRRAQRLYTTPTTTDSDTPPPTLS